jgi:biopolymer transport protein ExbD
MAFQNAAQPGTVAEINITPLVDVMLVLLIIFMVAAPMLSRAVPLDLPQSGPIPPPPDVVIDIRVGADGTLAWNGQPVSRAGLERALRLEAARGEIPLLQFEVDPRTQYADVAALLGTAHAHGLTRIALN